MDLSEVRAEVEAAGLDLEAAVGRAVCRLDAVRATLVETKDARFEGVIEMLDEHIQEYRAVSR